MLKQLSLDMGKPEYEMLQRIPAVENGFTNPAYNLSYDEYKEWLQITDNNSRGIDLPEDWIPYTTYVLY
ncbi:MAG: GNAT family N-acetyltransferase, partial [Eubacterium sp.]|nr:GNAT family N-acetyltransferase [Eubacterium sp.]